jgi:hypothetical protein
MRYLKKRRPLSSNPLNPGSTDSALTIAKKAKEAVNKLNNPEIKQDEPDVKCGIDNPCNFGKWNLLFNKNCLI